jgi:hypothetical protein
MPGQSIQGAFYVATAPPNPGTDPAPQVYASLGSGVIQVQTNTAGAANLATTGAFTVSNTAQQLLAARATRRSCVISNLDTALTVFIGNAGVTTATGKSISPGNSLTIPTVTAIYVICASGSPIVDAAEAYD